MGMLKTVDDAWEHFMGRVLDHVRADNDGKMASVSAIADDEALAAFVRQHPGVFEERLIAGVPQLVDTGSTDDAGRTAHQELMAMSVPGNRMEFLGPRGPLDATLGALDPLK